MYGDGGRGFTHFRQIASCWNERDWLRGPGDLSGDGRPDLITKLDGRLYLHAGTATGFAAPVSLGTGWDSLAAITSIGDFDGDRRADVVARTRDGSLRLYRGGGWGQLLTGTAIGGSFGGTRFAL